MRTALPILLLGSALLAADAGQTAPALDAVVWINLGKARPALRGKVTLVLFWATDNIQSSRS